MNFSTNYPPAGDNADPTIGKLRPALDARARNISKFISPRGLSIVERFARWYIYLALAGGFVSFGLTTLNIYPRPTVNFYFLILAVGGLGAVALGYAAESLLVRLKMIAKPAPQKKAPELFNFMKIRAYPAIEEPGAFTDPVGKDRNPAPVATDAKGAEMIGAEAQDKPKPIGTFPLDGGSFALDQPGGRPPVVVKWKINKD